MSRVSVYMERAAKIAALYKLERTAADERTQLEMEQKLSLDKCLQCDHAGRISEYDDRRCRVSYSCPTCHGYAYLMPLEITAALKTAELLSRIHGLKEST